MNPQRYYVEKLISQMSDDTKMQVLEELIKMHTGMAIHFVKELQKNR